MEAQYQRLLLRQDPVALSIEELTDFFEKGNPSRIVGGSWLTRGVLLRMSEGEWLDDNVLDMYVSMVAEHDTRVHVITALEFGWHLRAVNNPHGTEAETFRGLHLDPKTTIMLFPTHVTDNHWILCVARIPTIATDVRHLTLYNSLNNTHWNSVCHQAGQDVARVLTWLGSLEDSRLPTTWEIVVRNCGPQENSDDCGVFVAACAASAVLQIPAPTRVDGFRAIMARQVVARVKGEALGWDLVKVYLESQAEGERGDVMEGLEDEEMGEPQSGVLLCEWPGCPYETDDETSLDTHLRQNHDRIMWVCPFRTCCRPFQTEEETLCHIEVEYGGSSIDLPNILLDQFRKLDTNEQRRLRRVAQNTFTAACDSKQREEEEIGKMYAAYDHPTATQYFTGVGLLSQEKGASCRTL